MAIRVLSFEQMYRVRDPNYQGVAADTFAGQLKREFESNLKDAVSQRGEGDDVLSESGQYVNPETGEIEDQEPIDIYKTYKASAISQLKQDQRTIERLHSENGFPWGGIKELLKKHLPNDLDDVDKFAYHLVPEALDQVLGENAWESFKNPKGTTYARVKRKGLFN